MASQVEVSVICITYNHGEMLRQALNSMLEQKTNFEFEILVHDDCSTDGTTDILREYVNRYPKLIIPFYEEENQYNSGRKIIREIANDFVQGRYIAFCEGDDYWTNILKLQKQYEILEKHPQIDLCAGRGVVIEAGTGNRIGWMRPKDRSCIIPVQDVIAGGGQYFASASLFLRKSILASMTYEFEKEMELDYVWQIKGSLRGGAYYLDQELAAYRSGVEGAWSTRMNQNTKMRSEHFHRMVHMLETLDRETKFQYHEAVSKRIEMGKQGQFSFYEQLEANSKEILATLGTPNAIYVWGNGKRGMAFQHFSKKYDVPLNGICDSIEESVGSVTALGFTIVSTEEVRNSDGIIIASNQIVYDAIRRMNLAAKIINLQEFIRYE